MRLGWVLALALGLAGCRGAMAPRSLTEDRAQSTAPPPVEAEAVAISDPLAVGDVGLWNGWVGMRIARDGFGVPDQLFQRWSYDGSAEEKILARPNEAAGKLEVDGARMEPARGTTYLQRLDLRTGELVTEWRQGEVFVRVSISLAWNVPVLRQTVRLQAPPGSRVRWSQGQAQAEIPEEELVEASGKWERSREFRWNAPGGEEVPRFEPSPNPPDIELDGPIEDQQAIRALLFSLRRNWTPALAMPTGPMGLTSSQYFGHTFWDADIWVFPALALLDPAAASTLTRYRYATLPGARKNFAAWVATGTPIGLGSHVPDPKLSAISQALPAKFAWESGTSGLETVPGPSRFQDHVTGDVAFAFAQAEALGIATPEQANEIGRAAAGFWLHRVALEGAELHIKGTMSPDEFHTGDDDLYTNLLARWTLRRFAPNAPSQFYLPKDQESLSTYEGDPVRSYKQAAALLAVYPLQAPEAEAQAGVMLARFGDKVTPNGPAMSESIHALIQARLGEPDAAHQSWKKLLAEFADQPLAFFSEKRASDKSYFFTGAGGALQTVLFGFVGLRIHMPGQAEARSPAAEMPLAAGAKLQVEPHLPTAWKRVVIRNMTIRGKKYHLEVTHEGAKFLAATN